MTDSLVQLAIQLTRAMIPIIIVVGMIGNSLNIAVLTRPALYSHACSRYFLALSCNNLFYTSTFLVYRLLADGYQLDPTKASLISCKLISYVYQVCLLLSPYFIVLASIDRYCASSMNVQLRQFSNVKVTRWAILLIIILLMLFYINTAVLIDLRSNDTFGCRIRADSIYHQVYPIMQVVLFAIIAPSLMAVFGIMTIYNTKRVRIIPTAVTRHRRTENQLIRMLLLQVSTHIVLAVPASVTYLILILASTISVTPVFYFARMMSQLLMYFSYATPFILYLISARAYRKQLVRLLYKILRMQGHNQVYPTSNTITNTVVAMNTRTHIMSIIY